jgi:hypothetical protein
MTKRYQPKKLKNPVKAIREHCIECMGGRGIGQNTSKLIEECGSPECALFEFRFGKNPYTKKRELSEEHKLALQTGRDAKISSFPLSLGKKTGQKLGDLI